MSKRVPVRVSVGVERLLLAAARDPELKASLLSQREAAIRAAGFPLSRSELAMLCSIPSARLHATIDGVDPSPQNVERRTFLQAVAATSAAAATGAALQGCGDDDKPAKDSAPPKDSGPGDITVEAEMWWNPTDGNRP